MFCCVRTAEPLCSCDDFYDGAVCVDGATLWISSDDLLGFLTTLLICGSFDAENDDEKKKVADFSEVFCLNCCFLWTTRAAVMKPKQWSWKSEVKRDQLVLPYEAIYKMVFVLELTVVLFVLIHFHVFAFVLYLNKILALML